MNDEKKTRKRASDKVREYIPSCKEKSTLLAIANYADPDGTSCHPAIKSVAHDSGHSVRTVQSHLSTLVHRGYLIIIPGGKGPRDTHEYYIPCCRYTSEEMEEITGVSLNQLKLPLVQRDHSVVIPEGEVCILSVFRAEKDAKNVAKGAEFVTEGCESRTQPLPLPHQDHKIREEHLKSIGIGLKGKPVDRSYREEPVEAGMTPETRRLWYDQLAALGSGKAISKHIGVEWREVDD